MMALSSKRSPEDGRDWSSSTIDLLATPLPHRLESRASFDLESNLSICYGSFSRRSSLTLSSGPGDLGERPSSQASAIPIRINETDDADADGSDDLPSPESSVTNKDLEPRRMSLITAPLAVYRYRWWVLFIVWLVTFEEACIWNTWGPIADVSKLAFDWTDGSIALLANWGCIGFTMAAVPVSWAMGHRSLLRSVFVFAAVVCTMCTGLRCITTQPTAATVLINIGHLFNGLSAPVALCAGPVISAKWFPPSERVTSTAIAGMSTTAGVAASFLIGPLMVPDRHCNGTDVAMNVSSNSSISSYDTCIETIRDDIRRLMIVELGLSSVILLLVLFTLKTEPKSAPSHSSTIPRLRFIPGFKKLIKNGRYLAISMVYGLINGLFSGWGAVLSLILGAYGVSQTDAGFIGFYSTIAGGVSSILMARIADRYSRSHKKLILLLLLASFFVFLALTVTGMATLSGKTVPGQAAVYYVTVILGGVFQYGLIPINLELAVELSYPVAEGVTVVFMTFLSCVSTVFFLVLLYIPGIGVLWLNWALIAGIVAGSAVVVFVKPRYARLDSDLSDAVGVDGSNGKNKVSHSL